MNLAGPPFPYTRKDWDEWFPMIEKATSDALVEWREVDKSRKENERGSGEEKRWLGEGLPVSSIREVDPVTGEQKFIGDIGIRRREFMILGDEEEKKRLVEENNALEAGNPNIAWEMGCESFPFLRRFVPISSAHGINLSAFTSKGFPV
jgi:hypothetical protein